MAKRRAEHTLRHGAPSKRCLLSLSGADQPLQSTAPTGGLSPPSLLDLMGTRCRKRPRYPEEDPEKRAEGAPLHREPAYCDTRKHAANLLTVRASGGLLAGRSSAVASSSKKRPRGDCAGSEAVTPKANDGAGDYSATEDSAYNSFQYWRAPLPELNLSLLHDPSHSTSKDEPKYKDSSSEFMET